MRRLMLSAALLSMLAHPKPARAAYCFDAQITGFVRGHGNPTTFDGTSIFTREPIVAASWSIPIDSMVDVDGLGRYRVADRGMLGPAHIDVAVWSRAEAYAITSIRNVCVS
jgi:hypothetical protein